MKKILTLLYTVFGIAGTLFAQSVKPVSGVSDIREPVYAFTHAVVHLNAHTTLTDATLLVQKDRIQAVGQKLPLPGNAIVFDLKGRHIYPSFIDPFTDYGQPDPKKEARADRFNRGPQYETRNQGACSWNQAIKPEYNGAASFVIDGKRAEELRSLGFGIVHSIQDDGIARGTGVVVALIDQDEHQAILLNKASANYAFDKGSSTQDYPSSLMGSIALLRQSYLDASWYKQARNKDFDLSLEAWNANMALPQFFEVNNVQSAFRAIRIADEFGQQYVLRGSGDEYQRLEEVKKSRAQWIIPLNFPAAIDMSNPYDALDVSLGEMKHWELAPANASMLAKAGIVFSFTTSKLKESRDFLKHLRKTLRYGLSKEDALRALTEIPAMQLKIEQQAGSLDAGKKACFFIASGDVFEKGSIIQEQWLLGRKYVVNSSDSIDLRGEYQFEMTGLSQWKLKISGDQHKPDYKLAKDTIKAGVTATRIGNQMTLLFDLPQTKGSYRLNGMLVRNSPLTFSGEGTAPDGKWLKWTATYSAPDTVKKKASSDSLIQVGQVWYPNKAYGNASLPQAHPVLIRNATVWTNESAGILKEADVLINGTKIIQVAQDIDSAALHLSGLEVIDGKGLHLTSGIIDEHSHIAVEGDVNEGTQYISAEVRIGDVIDPNDINIYRQLAGGVTTSQLLHGSANPIGGQSAIIKLRWGKSAEAMKFEGADPFIKFALGENVKQANWGDDYTIRFPQTRMGVEQVYVDAFTRAREYDERWKQYSASKKAGIQPRRDLEMEALAEILNKKRFITCHSYQQGEINMLMHVADSFGFRVNTFTHILEGYKVADKMKRHGVGASSFADWWAYKMEVIEAIPYNGAILHKAGVTTGFNSDDAEMARRLNQEAAKAVMYGNVSEEEAWKFVTLNPAKLLHLDNRVGSIKAGKDADLVLWNGSPLSVSSHPLKTFVDGICYYDAQADGDKRSKNEAERVRLIQAMNDAKNGGESTQRPALQLLILEHCNDYETLPK